MIIYFAEFLGTFALLSAIFFTGNALIIGLTLAVVIWAIGDISGGHVNPAVSFAFYTRGTLTMLEYFLYSGSQFLGGIVAYYTYKYLS
jgi:glycerol uptake facilitator-like aquaporin